MAGAGYKLFVSGDVLTAAQVNNYLQEQAVMVFASAAARTTAISGVLAEGMVTYLQDTNTMEVYDGAAWIPASLTNSFYAGKNKIINGDFRIWQRGTSGFALGGAYNSDRWGFYRDGSGATDAITQQSFTAGAAPVAGYEAPFFWRYSATVAGTGGTERSLYQKIEDVRTFANQTVTVSFWAKADATRTITLSLSQNFGSGGSATVTTSLTSQSVTTSWARYSATVAIPSVSGKTIGTSSYLNLVLGFPVNVTETIDIWGVQVEAGSVATAFQTATSTLAGELAACQRYYWRNSASTSSNYLYMGNGFGVSSTRTDIVVQHPVPMRVSPTSIDYANLSVRDGSNNVAVTSVTSNVANQYASSIFADTASGITQYRPYSIFVNNSSGGYIGFNAEL